MALQRDNGDADVTETKEWLDALESVLEQAGV
jgi:pyruvate dehydrogenase complex dehydrogenase (E1) component